jgi:hypothetical protein
MKIRTITLGVNWQENNDPALEDEVKDFFSKSNSIFSEKGYQPRTTRITLSPFAIQDEPDAASARVIIKDVSAFCSDIGIRWFCVPFETAGGNMEKVNAVALDVAGQYKNAFINYIAAQDDQLDLNAFLQSARFVSDVSRLSDNGFDNFRCGVSFNCKSNGAFFPFTYHKGQNGFSIALEWALFCVDVIKKQQGRSLNDIRTDIIEGLLPVVRDVNDLGLKAEKETGMVYKGIDLSLAPHPEDQDNSVAFIIELLGMSDFGEKGTTFLTSFLTNIINSVITRSQIRATGFNGVMYSVLEDPKLGQVNKETGRLTVESLTAFSTMCGCGIDMVPVPGDLSAQRMASIMLDVGAISLRLNKPLGVRLLPIPGKVAGQLTDFDHDFLQNTTILGVEGGLDNETFFEDRHPFSYL